MAKTATKPKAEKPKAKEVTRSSQQGKRLARIEELDAKLTERFVNTQVLEDEVEDQKASNMKVLTDRIVVGLMFAFEQAFDPKAPELQASILKYEFWARYDLLIDGVGEAYLVEKGYPVLSEEELAALDSGQKKERNDKKSNGTRQMRDLGKVIGNGMTLMLAPSLLDDEECTAKAFRTERDQVLKDLKTSDGRTEIAERYETFCNGRAATLVSKRKKLEDAIAEVSKQRAEVGLLEKNHDFGTKRPRKTRPDGLTYFKGEKRA